VDGVVNLMEVERGAEARPNSIDASAWLTRLSRLSCGGPRIEDELIRPITDIVVSERVIGRLT
jgi:hypothetical protein